MAEWSVYVALAADGPVPDDVVERAMEQLEACSPVIGGRIEAPFEISVQASVEADDPMTAGWRMIEALAAAVGVLPRVVDMRVQTWDRFERELAEPNYPDLVSAPEVGKILGVSRQRVHQLVAENRHFPTPLYRLGAGPLWTRQSIEAFHRSWERKPGRPKGRRAVLDEDEFALGAPDDEPVMPAERVALAQA